MRAINSPVDRAAPATPASKRPLVPRLSLLGSHDPGRGPGSGVPCGFGFRTSGTRDRPGTKRGLWYGTRKRNSRRI